MVDVKSSTSQSSEADQQRSSVLHAGDELKPIEQNLRTFHQPMAGVFCMMAAAWIVGCAFAIEFPFAGIWLTAAGISLLVTAVLWQLGRLRQTTAAMVIGFLTMVMVSGAWTSVMNSTQQDDDIGRYASSERRLVRVTGQIDTPPRVTAPPRGAMAKFGYNNISTLYEMSVSSMETVDGPVAVTGRLLVREPLRNDKIMQGQQRTAMGWLKAPAGPMNPGEMDFRRWMADRGLSGFLSLPEPDSSVLIHEPSSRSNLVMLQATAGQIATRALASGLEDSPQELALLYTLLLGRRGQGLEAAQNAFRRVGLAHILSISGAHLGILVTIIVLMMIVAGAGPWVTAWVVTLVLGFYLLAIPPQVPVLRAAIMALLVVWGYAAGRRVPLLDPLALACILVLMWRPHELLAPGFQLSFGVVAGLVCFTAPVAQKLSPRPAIVGMPLTKWQRVFGWFMAYVAANLVAFVIALPLVMFHFHNVSPLTVILSIVTLPVVTLVLGVGYAKIFIGLFLTGLSGDIAPLLAWLTHVLLAVVQWASEFRIAYIELTHSPSVGWTAAALSLVIAVLGGWFHRRWFSLTLCVLMLGSWLTVLQLGYRTQMDVWPAKPGPEVALRVNFFSVGDGSCYLLRFMPSPTQDNRQNERPYTLMYDCGSRWVDGGLNSIIPALEALGVRTIDTLVISHADMDHFNAVIDLSWRVKINEVLLSPQMAKSIEDDTARSAPAYFLTFLRNQQIPMKIVSQGWEQARAGGQVQALWPPTDFVVDDDLNDNDLSVVLSVKAGGRRVLLTGDIQAIAMQAMLDQREEVKADVMDMPHHGSFVRGNSLMWLAAVSPTMVVQSSGMNRVEKDPWEEQLPQRIERLRTAESGMVELDILHNGQMKWRTFLADQPNVKLEEKQEEQ